MSNSITIAGVPPAVTRAQVMEALRVLGIDPHKCAAVRFDFMGIEIEVHSDARPGGVTKPRHRWTSDGKAAATHRLTIPILEEDQST